LAADPFRSFVGVPDVTLPSGYEHRDRMLASRIASELGLAELHVVLPPPPRAASAARRLPEADALGLLRFLGIVAEQLGRRLQR
jgi:hypothetical protein